MPEEVAKPPATGHRRSVDASRLAEIAEDAYFNEEEEPAPSLPKSQIGAASTLRRKRMRGNTMSAGSRPTGPRTGPAPLVDYEEEEDEAKASTSADETPEAGPSSPKDGSSSSADTVMDTEPGPSAPRPTGKRRRDEEEEDDPLSRLAARKRQALVSDDESDSRPVTSLARGSPAPTRKIQLVLGQTKASTSSAPTGPPEEEQRKDDGG